MRNRCQRRRVCFRAVNTTAGRDQDAAATRHGFPYLCVKAFLGQLREEVPGNIQLKALHILPKTPVHNHLDEMCYNPAHLRLVYIIPFGKRKRYGVLHTFCNLPLFWRNRAAGLGHI